MKMIKNDCPPINESVYYVTIRCILARYRILHFHHFSFSTRPPVVLPRTTHTREFIFFLISCSSQPIFPLAGILHSIINHGRSTPSPRSTRDQFRPNRPNSHPRAIFLSINVPIVGTPRVICRRRSRKRGDIRRPSDGHA